jgi:hypothetical protein
LGIGYIIKGADMDIKNILQTVYLDYLNNFITVAGFAEHYGLTTEQAEQVLDLGRTIHNERTNNEQ